MQTSQNAAFRQPLYVATMTPAQHLFDLARLIQPVATQFELTRIGSEYDGGYLLPDDLDGIAVCFSPGVDVNAGFELDLLRRKGIHSHLADYSVDSPPMSFQPKSFTKKFLGVVDEYHFMTLDTWVRGTPEFRSHEDLLLQMDIEGAEYLCLLGASEEILRRFRVIVVEIHQVEAWGEPHFFQVVVGLFRKLLKHFHVVHNHPNNCCGLVNLGGFIAPRVFELTLLRRDRARPLGLCQTFPHRYDRPNFSDREDLVLPRHWYNQVRAGATPT